MKNKLCLINLLEFLKAVTCRMYDEGLAHSNVDLLTNDDIHLIARSKFPPTDFKGSQ